MPNGFSPISNKDESTSSGSLTPIVPEIKVGMVVLVHGELKDRDYLLCDGSTISDSLSPMDGLDLPNLIGKVIEGANETGEGSLKFREFILYQNYHQWYRDTEIIKTVKLSPYMRIK